MSLLILKWGLLIIIFILAVPFFQSIAPEGEPQLSSITKKNMGIPIRIKIPNINVDAAIEQVSITPDGLMGVPSMVQNTGWYSPGIIPGEAGSAVIDGHVDGPGGSPAVFYNLHSLKPGDKITIENDKKELTVFTVTHSRSYNPKADSSEIFTSSDGIAHLNLITCSGEWDKNLNDYSERLVVFTNKD